MLRRTRRAPTACSGCRDRKVRCDASILGCPCTRCRQDGRSDCMLRDKLPTQFKIAPQISRQCPSHDQNRGLDSPLSHDVIENHPTDQGITVEQDLESTAQTRRSSLSYTQYPFISSYFVLSLPSEDVAFLASNCCLRLPDHDATDEFVCQYFKHIHPMVPVINEAAFWHIYHNGSGSDKISLFVFQALLFASCPFMSLETLRQCGFVDKRDARKQLYNRSKLLFDLKAETNPSAKAQGAVLLTHHTSAEDPQAGSLWLTRAVENTMIIGAEASSLAEDTNKSLRKRLWWSILLRDRSLCIGLRRRPQVTSINLHSWSDWLTEDDFEEEMRHSRVYHCEDKRRLFQSLQEQCQLAVLLTELVCLIFAPRVTPSNTLLLEEFRGLMCTVERIKQSLLEWETQARPAPGPSGTETQEPAAVLTSLTYMYLQFVCQNPPKGHALCAKKNWLTHSSAARVDLAQYAAFMMENNASIVGEEYEKHLIEIGRDLTSGIAGLTTVMEYFSHNGHADSLPLSVFVFLFVVTPIADFKVPELFTDLANHYSRLGYVGMPLVLAAIDLKLSHSYEEMTARKRRLDALSGIIRHSENLYDVTDFVAAGTNQILRLAYVTTQNLFLRPREFGEPIASVEGPRPRRARKHGPTKESWMNSRSYGRVKSWLDAFIQCPRAYLLISTSVDYSLAVGRLPYDNALPEIVRYIPAMGAVSRLPWTIHAHQGDHPMKRRSRRLGSRATLQTINADSDEPVQQLRSCSPKTSLITTPISECATHFVPAFRSQHPNSLEKTSDNHLRKTAVNLDFMDMADA